MTEQEIDEQITDFVAHRAEIKKPMSPVAIKRLRERALRMNAKGVDLLEAFDKAITSGWQSIYEPKVEATYRPASHSEYKGPDYGERTNPETARANVTQLKDLVRRRA